MPLLPGTVGSLLGIGLAALLHPLPLIAYLLVTGIFCVIAVWVADMALPRFSSHDPKVIVIDEIAGYLLVLAGHGWSWPLAFCGFLLFRVIDVVKPFPCRRLERLPGGLGIVADDIAAGCYANVLLWLLKQWVTL